MRREEGIDLLSKKPEKLSAMDVLARASMKDAAKCDTHCELQISVNHQISERIWRCRDFPAARLFQCLLTIPSTPHDRIQRECHEERDKGCVFYNLFLLFVVLSMVREWVSYGCRKNKFFRRLKMGLCKLSLASWMDGVANTYVVHITYCFVAFSTRKGAAS